ncbi:MAG: hypothetical protein ACC628_08995 [Pirellulaceae bacterium]
MRTGRIFLALAMALLIAIPGTAQEKKKKGRGGRISPTAQAMVRMMRIHDILEAIDLTAEQQEQLKKMHDEAGPKMKEIFGKMRDMLTEEQRSAAEAASKEAKEEGKKGRQFVVAVERAIKLTDEQKEEMAQFAPEIGAHQKEMLKGIRSILTPEQQEMFKKKMAPQRKKGGKKKQD